jgi:hypothetical protein
VFYVVLLVHGGSVIVGSCYSIFISGFGAYVPGIVLLIVLHCFGKDSMGSVWMKSLMILLLFLFLYDYCFAFVCLCYY